MNTPVTSSPVLVALVASLLSLGPTCGLADDALPRPGQIERLTPELARRLVEEHDGRDLVLTKLTTLDAATAAALAGFTGNSVRFSRLAALDADTATALAGSKAWTGYLPNLAALGADTAAALAGVSATVRLWDGIEPTSPDAEAALRANPRIEFAIIKK